jgi:hypothetical protein
LSPIFIKSRVGPDGVLSLHVPIGEAEANRDVLVIVNAAPAGVSLTADSQWREFIRQHAGSISDPTFTRHDQGEYERREPLV